ncbi:MAG: hypothetical protein HGA45_03750 [Chloroflexales bacterium]|nr:hypothetical protein [Chloroflexales bacterium]
MRHTNRLPLAIFLLLSGLYLLTLSGHTYSPDEETMLAVTRGLLERGSVAVVVEDGAPVSALRPGPDGGRYSPYGVLPSLLALPLQALGALLGGDDPGGRDYASRLAVTALNGPVTAATTAVLAAWALALGAPRRWAAALALLYGLATFAWPYTRTFFSEPLAALLILVSAYAAYRAQASGAIRRPAVSGRPWSQSPLVPLLISGLAGGLLLTTRIAAGIALPVIGIYVLWGSWRAWRRTGSPSSFILHPSAFMLGLLPGLLLLLWYNLARFGTPLASGYASEAGLFTTPLAEGLYGLLLSPGKSVLLFAPPLLLALPGAVALWRRGRAGVVLLGVGLFLSHLLLYARWGEWQGGGVWGPRFLLPVVAPLLVLAAGLSPREDLGRKTKAGPRLLQPALVSGLLSLVFLAGFAGNLGGVLLNFGTYVVAPEPADKLYSLAGSPLVGHWVMLAERWGRYAAPPPVCRLGDGLYDTEDPGGAPLPRRTGAVGELRCATNGARLSFTLDDRRPPAAPPSELRLLIAGRPLASPPSGQLREYRLLLPSGAAVITIEARTWNPRAAGFSERDDELGPQVAELGGVTVGGASVAVEDTAVAPLPARARPRWAWYYDPPNQHFADHWAWYLPRSELVGARAWALAGIILVLGAAALAGGLRLLR